MYPARRRCSSLTYSGMRAPRAWPAGRLDAQKIPLARRLYDRLGFRPIEEQGVYDLMEWRSETLR